MFPRLAELISTINSQSNGPVDLESYQSTMSEIAKSDELSEFLLSTLQGTLNNSENGFLCGYRVRQNTITLAESTDLILFLSFSNGESPRSERKLLYPSGRRIYVNISNDKVEIDTYRLSQAIQPEVFFRGAGLQSAGVVALSPRESYFFADDELVVDYLPTKSTLNLSLVQKSSIPAVNWIFNAETLQSEVSTTGITALSHLRSAVRTLGQLAVAANDSKSYIDTLARYTSHPYHIIRWTALQAISAVNIDTASPYLLKAMGDAHPEIQSSARRVLEKLGIQ